MTILEATQAQAQAGTDDSTLMTPLRVAQAIAALAPGGTSSGRDRFTTDRTYYIAPTGSDSNSGTSSAAPWATHQHAWDWTRDNLDLCGKNLLFSVANNGASHYAPFIARGRHTGAVQPSSVTFLGNTSNPDACVIEGVNAHAAYFLYGALARLDGIALTTTGTAGGNFSGLTVGQASVEYGHGDFGNCLWAHVHCAESGSVVRFTDPYNCFGSARYHVLCETLGEVQSQNNTITLSYPVMFTAFAAVTQGALVDLTGKTFPGSANVSGLKYALSGGGILVLGGNTLPGSGTSNDGTGIVA